MEAYTKINFALSLVWVAKLYGAIYQQSEPEYSQEAIFSRRGATLAIFALNHLWGISKGKHAIADYIWLRY